MLNLDLHSLKQRMLIALRTAALASVAIADTTASAVQLTRIESSQTGFELEKHKLDATDGVTPVRVDTTIAATNSASAQARTEGDRASAETAELKPAPERESAPRSQRRIEPLARTWIVAFLKDDPAPKGDVIVFWKLFDEEAEQFGKEVLSVLQDSGFNATQANGPTAFGLHGAWIVVRDLTKFQTTPRAWGAVQFAFREMIGVELDALQRNDPFPDLGEVVVAIGPNP